MKIALFDHFKLGIVKGALVYDVTEAVTWDVQKPQESLIRLMENLEAQKPQIESALKTVKSYSLSEVMLRAPVPNPSKIVLGCLFYRVLSRKAAEIGCTR